MRDTSKNDLSIDVSDIIDTFGGKVAEKESIKKENTHSPPKVTECKKDGIATLPELDEKLIEKQEMTIEKPDFKKEDNISELIIFVNEISKILKSELKKFVNEKQIDNMLLRSMEKMALLSFLFKNSNWNAEGNLRTDGTIDIERVIKNYTNYKDEPEKVEKESRPLYLC